MPPFRCLEWSGILIQTNSQDQAMPRQYLYHVTPTRNLKSILANGLEPRAGTWRGLEWEPRIWLATSHDAAYMTADIFLFEWRYGCGYHDPGAEPHSWKIEGRAGGYWWTHTGDKRTWVPAATRGEWQFVRGDTLSIIRIDRAKITGTVHSDLGDFHKRSTARKRHLATVWIADPIAADTIVDATELDQSYLISPAFRRYAGSNIRGIRSRFSRQSPERRAKK